MKPDTIDFSTLDTPVNERQISRRFFWSWKGLARIMFVMFWLALALYGYALLFNFEKNWQESDVSMFVLAIAGTSATWFLIGNFRWQLQLDLQLARLPDFAKQNQFNYFERLSDSGLRGRLFQMGDIPSRHYSKDVLAGTYMGRDFMIGTHHFESKLGNGRFEYGFIAVHLPKSLPQILLRSRKKGMEFTADFKSKQKLSLEGDFDRYFTLYVPEGYEQDALYILTPDLMALLIDHGNIYDIEISSDRIYFYCRPFRYTRGELKSFFDLIKVLGGAAHNRTKRYSDWRTSLGLPPGFLQSRIWQGVLLSIVFILLLVLQSIARASY